jgi:hypothetical protein
MWVTCITTPSTTTTPQGECVVVDLGDDIGAEDNWVGPDRIPEPKEAPPAESAPVNLEAGPPPPEEVVELLGQTLDAEEREGKVAPADAPREEDTPAIEEPEEWDGEDQYYQPLDSTRQL